MRGLSLQLLWMRPASSLGYCPHAPTLLLQALIAWAVACSVRSSAGDIRPKAVIGVLSGW